MFVRVLLSNFWCMDWRCGFACLRNWCLLFVICLLFGCFGLVAAFILFVDVFVAGTCWFVLNCLLVVDLFVFVVSSVWLSWNTCCVWYYCGLIDNAVRFVFACLAYYILYLLFCLCCFVLLLLLTVLLITMQVCWMMFYVAWF